MAIIELADLRREARARFGVRAFRPGQRAILEGVLAGEEVLGILPTGAGKSLCCQLPALFLSKPVIVVSPLIALMQDQQQKCEEANIAVSARGGAGAGWGARDGGVQEGGGEGDSGVVPEARSNVRVSVTPVSKLVREVVSPHLECD